MKLNFRCHYMSSIHSLGHARTKLPFKSLEKPEKIILLKHQKEQHHYSFISTTLRLNAATIAIHLPQNGAFARVYKKCFPRI